MGTSDGHLGVLGASTNRTAATGPTAYAGYFRGNVHVTGMLTMDNQPIAAELPMLAMLVI